MARYLTIDSQFKPVSFEEMLKPAQLYKTEYEKQQDAIDKLSENNMLAQLSNSSIDSNAYNAYKNYENTLHNVANDLMNTGKLNYNAVRDLKRTYNETIAPYEEKMEKRNKKIEEQAKNYSLNKLYSRDFSNISLDDITDDMSYKTIDLNDVYKNTATKLLAKYQSGEIDEDAQREIKDIFDNIDTDDFDDNKKVAILNTVIEGRNAALAGYDEYLAKKENERLVAEARLRTADASYNRATKNSGSTDKPTNGKSVISRTLADGTTVYIKKVGDNYFDKNGEQIDINNLDELSPNHGEERYSTTGFYTAKETGVNGEFTKYNIGDRNAGGGKTYAELFNDAPNKTTIRSKDELNKFIQNHSSDDKLLNVLHAVLGVNKNKGTDVGWFVNGKKIEIAKIQISSDRMIWMIKISTDIKPAKKVESENNSQSNATSSSENTTETTTPQVDTTTNVQSNTEQKEKTIEVPPEEEEEE